MQTVGSSGYHTSRSTRRRSSMGKRRLVGKGPAVCFARRVQSVCRSFPFLTATPFDRYDVYSMKPSSSSWSTTTSFGDRERIAKFSFICFTLFTFVRMITRMFARLHSDHSSVEQTSRTLAYFLSFVNNKSFNARTR